jgi:Pyruvate/2-oxoacid:ferredoxin oxidoreductase gamma subunit
MSTFNIKETDYKGFKLIRLYENKIIIPNNNNNRGKRYESQNMIKSIRSSLNRTKRTIKDYAHGTYWDYVITLTLDPKKINRYNKDTIQKQMNIFLTNYRKKNPNFQYMFIPEYHKDNAIHFHGYLKGIDSSDIKQTAKINKYGRIISNWIPWAKTFGLTRLDPMPDDITERIKMNNYTTKYITLDLMIQAKLYNKKRYYCSKGLPKPNTKYLTSSKVLHSFADYITDSSTDMLSYTTHSFKRKVDNEYKIVNTIHNLYFKDS